MGKSNSIEQQQKSNKAFQEYVNAMNKDMEEHVGKTSKELDALVEVHYKPFPDKASLLEGRYSHLSTVSEWSLASVQKMIASCRDAIFGAPAPAGSKKEDKPEEVSLAIQAIKSRELLIANAAFNIVQSLLGSFSSSTSTDVLTKIDVKPLSPGLTLFIGVMNNAYSRTDFFRNEKIRQNMFVYKVFYSIKEGHMTSMLGDLEAYEEQKAAFRAQMKEVSTKVAKLDTRSNDYREQLKDCSEDVKALNSMLKEIDTQIEALSKAPLAKALPPASEEALAVAECDAIAAAVGNRWEAAQAVWQSE